MRFRNDLFVEALIYSKSIIISNLRPFKEICSEHAKYIEQPSSELNWLKVIKNKTKKSNIINKNNIFYKKLSKYKYKNFSDRLFGIINE